MGIVLIPSYLVIILLKIYAFGKYKYFDVKHIFSTKNLKTSIKIPILGSEFWPLNRNFDVWKVGAHSRFAYGGFFNLQHLATPLNPLATNYGAVWPGRKKSADIWVPVDRSPFVKRLGREQVSQSCPSRSTWSEVNQVITCDISR